MLRLSSPPACLLAVILACCSVVLASASPSLELDQAYLQSTVATAFVVSDASSAGSSCFVPRCLVPDAANQRRLLRFGLRVRNQGDAEARIAQSSNAITNDVCSGAASVNDLVSLTVKDASNVTMASGVRDLCLYDQEMVTGYSGGGNVSSTSVYTSCRTTSPGSSTVAQGLSAGWQVTYTTDVTCMYLDITGLAAGDYTLEATLASVPSGSPASTTTASFTIDDSCPPTANYDSPKFTANTASQWEDPVAMGHTSVALQSAGIFSAPVELGTEPWIFGCTSFTSFAVDVAGRISFAPEDSEGAPTSKLGFTIAPFSASFVNGSAYYQITGSSPSRTLLVSWINVQANENFTNLSWQTEIEEDGGITFRYRNVAYQIDGEDAGEGRRQNIYVCGGGAGVVSGAATNCVVYTEQAATNGAAVVTANSTVFFPRQSPGYGTTRPTVSMSNTPSGSKFVVGTSVTFSASTGAPATLGWSFGDRFYPEEIAQTSVHNFSTIGTYTVRLTAFDGTYYVTSTKTITVTSGHRGGWTSEDTLAVVLGIFIPLTVIVCLVAIIIGALIVFFLSRGIVPSGGAWWNKDPEYVNTEAPIAAAL